MATSIQLLYTDSLSSDTSQEEMTMRLSCLIAALLTVCFIINANKQESVFANYDGTVRGALSTISSYDKKPYILLASSRGVQLLYEIPDFSTRFPDFNQKLGILCSAIYIYIYIK